MNEFITRTDTRMLMLYAIGTAVFVVASGSLLSLTYTTTTGNFVAWPMMLATGVAFTLLYLIIVGSVIVVGTRP